MPRTKFDVLRTLSTSSILFCLLVAGLRPPSTFAAATGTIVGTITDPTGAAVPGVEVTVTQESTQAARKVTTDQNGGYQFPLLPVGPYTLRAEKTGFQAFVQKGLVLQVDQNLTLPVTLGV